VVATSHICISADLVCDGVSHCGHGEDERANNFCSGDQVYDLIGLDVSQAVGGLLLLLLLLAAGSAAVWIWSYRRGTPAVELHTTPVTSSYTSSVKRKDGLTVSGNWELLVQGQGYKHISQSLGLVLCWG